MTLKDCLLYSSQYGNILDIKKCIVNGAYINTKDKHGHTALILSIRNRNTDIENCKLLLKYKASIDMTNKAGKTALIFAASFGYYEKLELLLAHHADVFILDNHNRNALSYAAEFGHTRCVELLVRYNYKMLRNLDRLNMSELNYSSRWGKIETVKFLVSFVRTNFSDTYFNDYINSSDINEYTPIMQACAWNHFEVVKILYENGADISKKNSHHYTVCDWALKSKQDNIYYMLLEPIFPNHEFKKAEKLLDGVSENDDIFPKHALENDICSSFDNLKISDEPSELPMPSSPLNTYNLHSRFMHPQLTSSGIYKYFN